MAVTPIEVPHPQQRERMPRLSEIDLRVPSLRPPQSNEELTDPKFEALARVDEVGRAHASSWQTWRIKQEERFRAAEEERRISRIKAWGTFICSVVAAVGAAVAAVLAAMR